MRIRQHVVVDDHGLDRGLKDVPAFSGWISPDPAPVVLHICHESRVESLKTFQLSFGTQLHPPCIYLNFSTDTVRLGNGHLVDGHWVGGGAMDNLLYIMLMLSRYRSPHDTDKIQYMSIDILGDLDARSNFCWDEIRWFKGLKELTMVAWKETAMVEELISQYRRDLTVVARVYSEWVVPKITIVSASTNEVWGEVTVNRSKSDAL